MHDPAIVAIVIGACVVVSEVLVRRTAARHLGTAMLVIVVAAVASNLGLVPTSGSVVYDGVFAYVAPMAIFWLLLRVDLSRVLRAGAPMLGLFLLGAAGTAAGTVLAVFVLGADAFGGHSPALAGMFTATYIGGSTNFNALALHYEVVEAGPIYAGAMAVDAGLTALWMGATLALPRLLRGGGSTAARGRIAVAASEPSSGPGHEDRESLTPLELAGVLTLGLAATWASDGLSTGLGRVGVDVPSILVLTVMALGLAQLGPIKRLRGAGLLGMTAVYVFLAVIGAQCDIAALAALGPLGLRIGGLAAICIAVHAVVVFGGAWVLRLDLDVAAVASQANIGGGTTALALARSLGRPDLVLPAIVVGSVGTALGTFAGFAVAGALG